MRNPWRRMNRRRSRGVQKELVTLMMEMTLTTPTLMVMMTALMEVMVVMVVMEVMVRYIHRAITARLTHAAAIRDAVRQALVVNRDRHFDDIEWEEDCYLPRHRSGQSTCNIAAPLGEENFRLKPTLECLAEVNTYLYQTLDELDAMGKAYLQLAHEHAVLKQQLGGPDLEVPAGPC
jgi:hypothetical protein